MTSTVIDDALFFHCATSIKGAAVKNTFTFSRIEESSVVDTVRPRSPQHGTRARGCHCHGADIIGVLVDVTLAPRSITRHCLYAIDPTSVRGDFVVGIRTGDS